MLDHLAVGDANDVDAVDGDRPARRGDALKPALVRRMHYAVDGYPVSLCHHQLDRIMLVGKTL